MPEQWRPVHGFPGYQVSSLGRVISCKRPEVTRILSTFPNTGGYLSVHLWRDGRRRTLAVHRLVAVAFLGDTPEGRVRRHLNGDKSNNSVANLSFGTQSENCLDMVDHGSHVQSRKEECPAGHAYDEINTYLTPAGTRACRVCRRENWRAYYYRRIARSANRP